MKTKSRREKVGGEVYQFVPLGKFVVAAPGVCGGRPTFKYTRIEVSGVLEWLGAGNPVDELISRYAGRISREAIKEATILAAKALVRDATARVGK